jgi:hypothetical protein
VLQTDCSEHSVPAVKLLQPMLFSLLPSPEPVSQPTTMDITVISRTAIAKNKACFFFMVFLLAVFPAV